MIDFALSEEEQLVVELAADFGERHLRAHARRHEVEGLDPAVHQAFAEVGLSALAADDPDMSEISWPARMQVISALARADCGGFLPLWMKARSPGLAAMVGAEEVGFVHLCDDATEDVGWLPLGGAKVVLFVEPDGRWIRADIESTDARALGLRAAGGGVRRGGVRTIGVRSSQDLTPNVLTPHASTPHALIAEIRLIAAAALVGIATASRDYAEKYVQERITFGRPLSNHQGVAFLVADVAMAIAGAEVLVLKAAKDLESGVLGTATDAYLEAVEAALLATSQGVQLLGGHGFMDEHPVEMWMRDARALSLLWGGVDAARRDAR